MLTDSKPQLYANIKLANLAHNVDVFQKLHPNKKLIAVVKADAYGHGAIEFSQQLLKLGVKSLGTTTIDEALTLRKAGISVPILVWLNSLQADYAAAIAQQINIAVSSKQQLSQLVEIAKQTKKTALVSIKLDTGLNRNGFKPSELEGIIPLLQTATETNAVQLQDIFSHLSHAHIPRHKITQLQKNTLTQAIQLLAHHGLHFSESHIANTALALDNSLSDDFSAMRIGIGLYGYNPLQSTNPLPLKPVMNLNSEVLLIKNIKAGEGVSYGASWQAPTDTTIALIAGGYADGINRALSNNFSVHIKGATYPAIGQICMDQFLVDLGTNPHAINVGDTVQLFGDNSTERELNTATTWAQKINSIDYEVLCHIGSRVKRIYQ